jgi:hypothetical protein
MRSRRFAAGLARVALPLVLAGACAVRVPPPHAARGEAADPDSAWAAVLSRFVDEKGRIDFAGLAREPGDLERYVAHLSRVGPASEPGRYPTPEARLAYWINGYNALAMYNAIRSGMPPDLYKVRVRFFYRDSFLLDGSYISLYDLENKVVRPLGDPRVHAALNCMARGCPRLPREPFRADMLDAELEATNQYFFNEERNVRLDPEKKTVHLNQILEFYTEDFLKKAPSLIAWVNRYRSSPIPGDWKVAFIPYDWRLNSR